jgi:SpoVK/Ycf46/Vps4 family AAA+-type ATPase
MVLMHSYALIRELFALARQKCPAVVFVDEIDSMVTKRGQVTGLSERVLSTFLNEMDGITSLDSVIVIGATTEKMHWMRPCVGLADLTV